jgi:hypothetical protein
MKKQELIHLHTLLAEVANYCQDEGIPLDLSAYRAQDTRPMAISHAKDDHEVAVLALAGGTASSLDRRADEKGDVVPASAD